MRQTPKSRHTPGPWIVRNMSDAFSEKFTIERVINDMRSVICRINDMEVCPEHGGTGSDANAALIAAAPELLAIIKDMRQAFYVEGTRKALLQVMERSKDLIAKAEGR